MRIGKLDQEIQLFSIVTTNDLGDTIETPTLEDTVFAHVMSSTGKEAIEAARNNQREVIRVLIRYRTDIQSTWQIVWEGQTYNITGIDRKNRRQDQIWLNCEVVGAV